VAIRVWHYDGVSAVRHDCVLTVEGEGFRLSEGNDADILHRWTALTPIAHGRSGASSFGHAEIEGWRLGFPDGIPAQLAGVLPRTKGYGGIIDRFGLWPASAAFLVASAAVVLAVIQIPTLLAPLIPMAWEKSLGDAMIGDLDGRLCHGLGSDDALAMLQAKLDPGKEPVTVSIANIDMVNAVALPGGRVLIFNGLLKEAKSPDELAGVLGHEIGHVRNRDVAQSLLRQFGLSLIIGGGNSGAMLNSLISASYSRGAESKADKHAMALMAAANVSPIATAGFFGRLAKGEKELGQGAAALGYLSSHPLSADREKLFRNSAKAGQAYAPILTDAQWQALVQSCAKDLKVKKDDGGFF